MSYILEALKKAQAERQLGNAPTIHAPTLHAAPAHVPVVKKTGVLALGVGVVVLAGAGWFLWSQRTPAPALVLTAPAVVAAVPAPVVVAPAPVVSPTAAPVAAAPAVVAPPAPVMAQAEPVVRPRKAAAAPSVAAPVAAPAAAPSPEDNLRYARDLPQEIQQQLPHVAFGGYMYSDYAADRLVLVDKTLRHEGEEIAPGLMLEKLLPRGAVLNFRGTRYRVNF